MIKLCYCLSPANIKYLCYITVEDNKSKDRENTSTQNDDQQSNSGVHASDQTIAQLDYKSKLNTHLTHILTIILLSMVVLNVQGWVATFL